MFFAATLLVFAPLVFLALSVHAQTTTYAIVNPITGLVIEDHDWVPYQVGNPITGSPYTGLHRQLWEVILVPGYAVQFVRNRHVGPQQIFIGGDGPPGTTLFALDVGTSFYLPSPFGTDNGIFAIESFSTNLAITAPSVANGTLTLQPYNASNQYQHWVFVPPDTPVIDLPSRGPRRSPGPRSSE